jgi:cytochrome bd ubiquinol oxidase subunit II
VEASQSHDAEFIGVFRLRALLAGAITAALGVLGLILAPSEAPLLWDGMLDHALPAIIVTMLIGLGTAAALWWKYYHLARLLIILTTAGMLGTWGLSQMPYLIPPDVTIERAACPT